MTDQSLDPSADKPTPDGPDPSPSEPTPGAAARALLSAVTKRLPGGGEVREGQLAMCEAVADAVADKETLLVEAGTGTGKSFAYLTPTVAMKSQVVVATATIALQSQLVEHDLPLVAKGLGREVSVALLKGRRNYLCRQRVTELELASRSEQLELLGGRNPDNDFADILAWAAETTTGDKEELDPAPPFEVWSAVSVGSDECPGATRCPSGDDCCAEYARARAMEADVIVTNHHYYGLNIASGGILLPDHDVVVFDEAHQLPEILGATCGTELSGGRLRNTARQVRSILTDDEIRASLDRTAIELDEILRPDLGRSVEPVGELLEVVLTARQRAAEVIENLRKVTAGEGTTEAARIERVMQSTTRLAADCDEIIGAAESDVVWVDGGPNNPVLRRTPLELGSLLEAQLWPDRCVVLTSATLADGVVAQLGLGPDQTVQRVGSPFPYEDLGLLYCPTDLPNPNNPNHRRAAQDEMLGLVRAAGGKTLCLFTSYAAMEEAVERLRDELDVPVLMQGDKAKQRLLDAFRDDPSSVLAATMSFWQGIDVPGDSLTVVTIDRIPFPRPNEPVAQARRDRAGAMAFRVVDLPRAQTLLAQAAGRLVRSGTDRGVVAVLDPRLANSRAYRWDLIHALPPFRRTKDRIEVQQFLSDLGAEPDQ